MDKKFTLEVATNENGSFEIATVTTGFNPFELVGVLHRVMAQLISQTVAFDKNLEQQSGVN